jgi:hypothetical protein
MKNLTNFRKDLKKAARKDDNRHGQLLVQK